MEYAKEDKLTGRGDTQTVSGTLLVFYIVLLICLCTNVCTVIVN
jgi:hypothetical protein